MSTRQYIGARYVPKFFDWDGSAEWRSGVAYEALTIVTRNGNSYTSKIPVPSNIGAPENNPTYWVATGLYNEQLESIRDALITAQGDITALDQEIDGVADRVTTAEGDIDSLEGRMDTAEGDVDSLEGRMDTAEGDIDAVEGDIANLESEVFNPEKPVGMKNCIFIGDSYGAGYHTSNPNWISGVIARLGLSSTQYDVSAVGSTGFGYTNGSNQNFRTMLTALSNNETTEFKNNVTHIFVCGGANDTLASFTDIVTGIQQFTTLAAQYYPNAKVYIGFIGCTTDATKIKIYGDTCSTYIITSGKHCYLNGVEYILRNRNYISSDGVHPTSAAYGALSEYIYRAIMTGSCDIKYNLTRGTLGTTNRDLMEYMDNGLYNLTTNSFVNFSFPNGETIQSAATYRLILKEMGAGLAVGSYYENCMSNILVTIYKQAGGWEVIPAQVIIYNNNLELKFVSMPYQWSEVVTSIYVPPICLNFPTMYC